MRQRSQSGPDDDKRCDSGADDKRVTTALTRARLP